MKVNFFCILISNAIDHKFGEAYKLTLKVFFRELLFQGQAVCNDIVVIMDLKAWMVLSVMEVNLYIFLSIAIDDKFGDAWSLVQLCS